MCNNIQMIPLSHNLSSARFLTNQGKQVGRFKKAGLFLISVFSIQLTAKKCSIYKSLPTTGFEPRTSGVGSYRSTNWATTTAQVARFSPLWNLLLTILISVSALKIYVLTLHKRICQLPILRNNMTSMTRQGYYWKCLVQIFLTKEIAFWAIYKI